jgi:hypothetical protein
MQILHPGELPFLIAMKIILLILCLIIAFILYWYGKSWNVRNHPKRGVGVAMLSGASFLMIFAISNFIQYQTQASDAAQPYVGEYRITGGVEFLRLNEDMTWKSNSHYLLCDYGYWKYRITEDFREIELYCHHENNVHKRTYDFSAVHITFRDMGVATTFCKTR